ncbi:RTA1 domain protein [Rutstroemia sp. NJR-2017a BBW]|nr:RTA1 domain protein [Rutstroemia sp. NJR-2017a BBW]
MISPRSQTPHSHYHYDPSLAAAIIFSVLYSITFLISLYQWIRYKAGVWAIMVFAAAMEAIGYIVRAISTQHTFNDTLYVIQFTLIFLAPVFMAAACYLVFGRIIYHVVPKEARNTKLLWISPRFVTPTFVLCDIGGFPVISSSLRAYPSFQTLSYHPPHFMSPPLSLSLPTYPPNQLTHPLSRPPPPTKRRHKIHLHRPQHAQRPIRDRVWPERRACGSECGTRLFRAVYHHRWAV